MELSEKLCWLYYMIKKPVRPRYGKEHFLASHFEYIYYYANYQFPVLAIVLSYLGAYLKHLISA